MRLNEELEAEFGACTEENNEISNTKVQNVCVVSTGEEGTKWGCWVTCADSLPEFDVRKSVVGFVWVGVCFRCEDWTDDK